MSEISRQYDSLLEKLDQFIRKYYTNELMRGGIFAAIYILAFFLAINLLEYYLYLPTLWRKFLFFGFLLSSATFVALYVVRPLLHYYRLGKVITAEQAATIIGQHFSGVKDKLLNVLQLKKLETLDDYSLVNASISQKITELKPFRFSSAIDLKQNRKYLRFLWPPLILFVGILLLAPNIIRQGTQRLYHNDTTFEKQAPFQFLIQNKQLKVLQFETLTLRVTTTGEALPAEVYVNASGGLFKMKQTEKNVFTHDFVNLQESQNFHLSANGFDSKEYTIDVVSKPVVSGFEVAADYPAYTGKADEVIRNAGDLSVPAGTRLSWRFEAQHTDALNFVLGDSAYDTKNNGNGVFTFSRTFLQGTAYGIRVSNGAIKNADSVFYSLGVIHDLYPVINVEEKRDSLNDKYFYYLGDISDDYGIKRLTFNYQLLSSDSGTSRAMKVIEVPFSGTAASRFNYFWNYQELGIKPGDKMTYYFEVWDNDGVHGSKSTKSQLMRFDMPSQNEIEKNLAKESNEIKDDLKQGLKQAEKMKNDLQQMQDKMLDKKKLNWEDKKQLADLMAKQKEMQQQLEETKSKMKQNMEKQEEFKDLDPSIKEKQQQLQDLFNQTMNSEMKKLFEQLEKMMDELQKKDAVEKVEDMKLNQEKMQKELDRMLELFKKLEFDQKVQDAIDKLNKLADKQEELAKATEKLEQARNDKNNQTKEKKGELEKQQQDLKAQQDKLNQEMKDAQKQVDDMKKLNDEAKDNKDMQGAEQDMDNAQKDQESAEQNLNQQKNDQASKNQKSAAQNMKNAASKMQQMKQGMEQEENAEDMQLLRQLLKNVLTLSFDQEKLMNTIKVTNVNTPGYVGLMKEQQRIKENSELVEDSLFALAKRNFQIKSFITKQITDINKFLGKSIQDLEDRNTFRAAGNQQYVMTGLNNLALMLSETQEQMQQQQSESMPKDGKPKMCKNCKKPGMGLPNLSKMQKQLSDKISQMGEQMKKMGQGKEGQQGQAQPKNGMSKEFAEMAAQQAAMRKELERINSQQNKDGKGSLGDLGKAIQQMEQNETDLVNKRITNEMLRRQQEIMVRLLDAEKAEKERGEKPERESNTGKETERKMPPSLEEYLRQKQAEVDWYKTLPPSLKPYYKTLAEKYFKAIKP
ncbi:MAG: DUF4175 family protein [Chitinophagales bacterium]